MRGFDRDLIRGGHYGQRSCEPQQKAEHMAAPTKPAGVKKVLANPEPSTHGTKRRKTMSATTSASGGEAEMLQTVLIRSRPGPDINRRACPLPARCLGVCSIYAPSA